MSMSMSSCDECNVCLNAKPTNRKFDCAKFCDECSIEKLKKTANKKGHEPPYYSEHPYLPDPELPMWGQGLPPQGLPIPRTHHAYSRAVTGKVCGEVMYADYITQYNDYVNCGICQASKLCWSKERQVCVKCPLDHQSDIDCKKLYGCPSERGAFFGYTEPVDPMYTNCVACWGKNYYSAKN